MQPNLKKEETLSPEQIASMETELAQLESEYKIAEQSFGDNVLRMVVYRGYLIRLIENKEVTEYLSSRYNEIFTEFQRIVELYANEV